MPVNVMDVAEFIITEAAPALTNPVPIHEIAEALTLKVLRAVVFPIALDKVTAPVDPAFKISPF